MHGPWKQEGLEILRAVSGGLLFGIPLLYTMEVWWTGSHTTPTQMAVLLVMLTVPVFILNHTAGFRATPDVRFSDAVADTIEAVAIGIVATASVLVLLRQITPSTAVGVGMGKVLYESVPFCLGVGVARHFFRGERSNPDPGEPSLNPTIADLGATAIGAIFISLSIAPTDEVLLIAGAMTPIWLIALMAASLGASYAIVFAAGFSGQNDRHEHEGIAQRPLTETAVSYLMALLIAAVLLWTFQRDLQPWTQLVAQVIVLGLPAAVGGAAGRLAI